jgi:hypothetical protein
MTWNKFVFCETLENLSCHEQKTLKNLATQAEEANKLENTGAMINNNAGK